MKKKIIISLIIGGTLSVLALYLAFRNVPLSDLFQYLTTVNYLWIIPTVAVIVITFVLRVLRWQIILRNAQSVPFWPAFHPLMIGFMMNCILPGRVGELARPVLLKKDRNIPMATGLATVAAERLLDIVLLIVLFGAVFSVIVERPDLQVQIGSQKLNSETLQSVAMGLIRLSLVIILMMVLLAITKVRSLISQIILALARSRLPAAIGIQSAAMKVAQLSIGLMHNFAEGLSLVAQPLRLVACLMITVLIWAFTVLGYYIMSMGYPGLELTLWEWTTVMVIICFFIALPSVPGFWGLWEAGGVFALSIFGVGSQQAAGFILVNHTVQLFPVILIGLLSALITGVNIYKMRFNEKAPEPITKWSGSCQN